jgi:hypothetical protein
MNISLRISVILLLIPSHASAQDLLKQFPIRGEAAPRKGPSQKTVARKSAFPFVSAASLSRVNKAFDLAAARKQIGKNARFVGVVTQVYTPKSGSIVLLNFAKNYKTALVGVVKARDFAQFPNLQNLRAKKVALSGKVISYHGRPEIELRAPGAIRLVK